MQTILQDLRFGVRMLIKARGFTVVATLVLALGIGSTTAVFGLINTLLLQSTPSHPDGEAFGIYSRDRERPDQYQAVSYAAFADLRERGVLAAVSGQAFGLAGLREGDVVRRVFAGVITSGFFDTFGAPPALGRDFTREEERPGADIPAVILSHDLWVRLGGTPDVVGSTITVNARAFTVVGVARQGFSGSSALFGPELWAPTGVFDALSQIGSAPELPFGDRRNESLVLMGRLPPGARPDTINAQLDRVSADLERAYPVEHEHLQFHLGALSDLGISTDPPDDAPISNVMLVVLAMSAIVMLISALNVSNMLLARAGARRKELAIRLAIGGGRWRLVRQLVTEGFLLAALGGAAGVLLATWVNSLLFSMVASTMNATRLAVLNLDARPDAFVLGTTLVACVVCTLAFSLGPAWRLVRTDSLAALNGQAGETDRGGRRWTANALVAGQIALSLVLLTVAGLFVRMATTSARTDPGFSFERGVIVSIDPSLMGQNRAQMLELYGDVLRSMRGAPGVEAASFASVLPFGPTTQRRGVQRPGPQVNAADPGAERSLVRAVWTSVSADYFRSLGLTVPAGREFSEAEATQPAAGVAIIDRGVADTLFPDQNPLGQLIQYAGATPDQPVVLEVVGIAPPIRHNQFERSAEPHIYTPYGRDVPTSGFIQVQTSAPTAAAEAAMLPSIRQVMHSVDPDVPIISIETMPMYRDASMVLALLRMGAGTFMGFGLMALFMATIGVYGVKAYLVASRTREISIRVTLGARPMDVQWLVLRQGLGVGVAGVVVGLALALAASSAVQGIVLTGGTFDFTVFATAAAVLVAAVLVASWLPARRATRVSATSFMRS